jgi:hypothetical protein
MDDAVMKHEKYSELMTLDRYGELTPEEKADLDRHLEDCPVCRRERLELTDFDSLLTLYEPEAAEDFVLKARAELMDRLLVRPEIKSPPPSKNPGIRHWWLKAAASLLILLGGVWIGSVWTPSGEESFQALLIEGDPFSNPDVEVSEVSFHETLPDSGEVELRFRASRTFAVRGRLEDERIQRLLAYSLVHEKNPGVRLQAVQSLDHAGGQRDPQVQAALIAALQTDPNPAVRERALMALRGHSFSDAIKRALLRALVEDENAKIRMEAIQSLEEAFKSQTHFDPAVVRELERNASQETNEYIRLRTQAVLQEVVQK